MESPIPHSTAMLHQMAANVIDDNRVRDAVLAQYPGSRVIYGDTDSVFVLLPEGAGPAAEEGAALETFLNDYWRDALRTRFSIESCLEVEYETPSCRGKRIDD